MKGEILMDKQINRNFINYFYCVIEREYTFIMLMMLFNLTVFCELFLDMPNMYTPFLMIRTVLKWITHYFSGCMQIFILANILHLIKNKRLHNGISYGIISVCGLLFIIDIFVLYFSFGFRSSKT